MYRALRRALFLIAPERIHTWVFAFLRGVTAVLPLRRVLTGWLAPHDPVLASTVFGVRFAGPLGLAAGFDQGLVEVSGGEALAAVCADGDAAVGAGFSG